MAGRIGLGAADSSGHPATLRPSDLLPADQPHRPQPPLRRWRYSPGARFAAFVVAVALTYVALLAVGSIPPIADLSARYWWLARLAQLAAVIVGYAVLLWVEQRRPIELLRRPWRSLGGGLLLGTGLCVAVFLTLFVAGAYRVVGTNPEFDWLPALISSCLVAAVLEEVVFRGVLFRLGEDLLGTWTTVALSAALFGATHLLNAGMSIWGALAIALEAGLLLAALYAVTRSLWWCIGMHFAWNLLSDYVFGGSSASDSPAPSGWLRAELAGPTWLTGGELGVGGSIVTVSLLTAVAVWLLLRIRRERLAVPPSWTRKRLLRERPAGADQEA